MRKRFRSLVATDKQVEAALIVSTCIGLGIFILAAAVLARILGIPLPPSP